MNYLCSKRGFHSESVVGEQLWSAPRSQSTLDYFRVPEPCVAAILDCHMIHGILWVLQETFLKAHLLEKDHPHLSSKIQGICAGTHDDNATIRHENSNHITSKHAMQEPALWWLTILPGWVITRVGPGLTPQYTRAPECGEAVGCSPTAHKCHDSMIPYDRKERTLPQQIGIIFSRIETWYYRKYCQDGESRAAEFVDTCTTLPKRLEILIILVELLLSVVWLIIRDSRFRNCIREIFLTLWNNKAGKSTSGLKYAQKSRTSSHDSVDQRSRDSEVNWRTYDIAIDVVAKRFRDYDVLDALIASALKKLLDEHVRFRKRVSVEEQRAQRYDWFLRGNQLAYMIYEYFRATERYEAVQGPTNLIATSLQIDDVQDFDVRWDQALLSAIEAPTEMILEGLYKSKLQDSVQIQTVLALYDQEIVRNGGHPSFSRLKTSVSFNIDQMMWTRTFGVRNEILERGSVSKSQKGKKAYVERKVGECFQWKAKGQCLKGDSCSFRHDPASGNGCEAHRAKGRSSSLAPRSKAKTDGEGETQKIGKERVHREELFKSAKLMNVVFAHLGLKMCPRSSMEFGENIYKLKNPDKATFYSLARIRGWFWSFNAYAEQKRF